MEPQVVVRVVPVASSSAAMSSKRNSGTASVWIMSGAPRRKKTSSSKRGEGVGFAVGEGNNENGFNEAIYNGESFHFACCCLALTLEVHT